MKVGRKHASNVACDLSHNDCGPFQSDVTGRMTCPEGLSLRPVPCWYCQGFGCKYCHMTGYMPACRSCKGGRALIGTIIKSLEQDPQRTIEQLEATNSYKWWKRKAYIKQLVRKNV